MYIYPTDPSWKDVARAAVAYPDIPVWAVINPLSGPGTSSNPDYVKGVLSLRHAGVKVLGYVATGQAAKAVQNVLNECASYRNWYGVDGIFFDQLNPSGQEAYYWTIADSLRQVLLLVGNPGVAVPDSYMGILDNYVVYENAGLPPSPPPTNKDFEIKNFSYIAHSVPTFPADSALPSKDQYGFMYVTSLTLPNPYDGVPYLWNLFAALYRSANAYILSRTQIVSQAGVI